MSKTCIVILYYNKINLTIKCINSVIQSEYSPEIILAFDNGSSVENHDAIKSGFPQILHNRREVNAGYSGGFNSAIKSAIKKGFTGFLFLTNDTLIEKDTLKNISVHSEKYASEFIAPKIVYSSEPAKIDSIGGLFDAKNFTLGHYKDEKLPLELNPKTDYIPGTALWLTKNVFEKLDGMDESYHTYWEDVDFSFRAHEAGIKITRSYEAVVSHGVGKTCHKKPLYSTYYFQRNRIKFCKKYLSEKKWKNAEKIILNDIERIKAKAKGNNIKLGYIEKLLEELNN